MWEAQRPYMTLWKVSLCETFFFFFPVNNGVHEFLRTPLRWVILCLGLPRLEKEDLTDFFHLRVIYLFFVLDTALKVSRKSKTAPCKDSEISITFNYSQLSPLITYYGSWDLLQSNNSGAFCIYIVPFSEEFSVLIDMTSLLI